jgi:hypothetical protein
MDPEAARALARAVLVDLDPGEARAISAALQPMVARLHALPDPPAEAPPPLPAGSGGELRADEPGPALAREVILAGVPAATADGLVRVGRFAAQQDVTPASRSEERP